VQKRKKDELFKSIYYKIAAQEDLPYLQTPFETIRSIFTYLEEKKILNGSNRLIDLGAGDGRIIIYASEIHKIKSIGIEINKSLVNMAKSLIKQRNLKKICQIKEGDLYDQNLADYDIIVFFMFPSSHRTLYHLIKKILKGTTVISIRWPLDTFDSEWKLINTITVNPQFPVWIYIKK
jgi:hypothetical protein